MSCLSALVNTLLVESGFSLYQTEEEGRKEVASLTLLQMTVLSHHQPVLFLKLAAFRADYKYNYQISIKAEREVRW